MKKIPQDIIGNIAILKFPRRTPWIVKKLKARRFLKESGAVTTVVEKIEGFSGRLRVPKTRHLAGIKTKRAIYKENQCVFRFNIDEVYFSPRLSSERKIVADEVVRLCKKNARILVMFAGVSPYSIVIAKKLKLVKKRALVVSNELSRKANREAERNIALNKLQDYVSLVGGDAKKLAARVRGKFDIILMPRPNLRDSFLKSALRLSKRGTVIFYYGFGTRDGVLDEIKRDGGDRIGRIKIRKAGDIGAYRYRWLARFRIRR